MIKFKKNRRLRAARLAGCWLGGAAVWFVGLYRSLERKAKERETGETAPPRGGFNAPEKIAS